MISDRQHFNGNIQSSKLFVVLTSCLIIIFGIATLSFAIYVLLDLGDILEIVPSQHYRNGAYIATFSGIFIIIFGLLAIFAIVNTNRFFLILACSFYLIIVVLLLIAGIFILIFDKNMDNSALLSMQDSLTNWYNKTSLISRAWDQTQSRFRCCAVSDNGWLLYRASYWSQMLNRNLYFPNPMTDQDPFFVMVPLSCCYTVIDAITRWPTATPLNVALCQNFQFGPPRFVDGAHNSAIYYRGCFNATKSYIGHFSGWLGGLSLISIVPLLIAFVAIVKLLNAMSVKKSE